MKTKLIGLLILMSSCLFAQVNYIDVVYLKNGSIIRGTIIEQIPNKSIKIITKDQNVFVFKMEEIEKITKENTNEISSPENKPPANYKEKGYIIIAEIAFSQGFGVVPISYYYINKNNQAYSLSFHFINGLQINPHFSAGLGLGIDIFKKVESVGISDDYIMTLPIFIDARYYFIKGKITPLLLADIGYTIGLKENTFNTYNQNYLPSGEKSYYPISGLMVNPEFGFKVFLSNNTAYLFTIGYKLQQQKIMDYNYNIYNNYSLKDFNANYVTFRMGVSF